MALTDKLRNLDQRLLPGTREQEEDAETYLRRVAAGRAISPAQVGDVMAALRVYFDVAPGEQDESEQKDEAGEQDESEQKDESGDKDDESGEQKDESGSKDDESDES